MKKWILGGLALLATAGAVRAASSFLNDYWTINGKGSLYNTAIAWIDTNRDLSLYDGDIYLGASGATPSTSAFAGLKVPFYNAAPTSMAQGTIVIASGTASTAGYGSFGAVLATTSVVGVCEGVVASGAVGYMTVSGYALVLTTGPVMLGNVIVTTGTVAGYGGATNAPTTGTDVGVAMSQGTTTGGLTLVRLR